ncbi:MAG: AraC family transcriptional regulator [Clostridiales bacterium]|jgi:AraC-like DNA-binding protein|nr:AraC family transcriptional regulator [Clostridiales bacterium]
MVRYGSIITDQPAIRKWGKHYTQDEVASFGIALFYSVSFENDHRVKPIAIADACADVLFYKNDRTGDAGAELAGPVTSPSPIGFCFRPGYKYFGARFLSGHSPLFAKAALSATVDRRIPLSEVCRNDDFTRHLLSNWNHHWQAQTFMDLYSDLFEHAEFSEKRALCGYIVNKFLESADDINLTTLENETGYSRQYINGIFQEKVGFSVMRFGKVLRIHNLLQSLRDSQERGALASASYDLGFADQSHMIRDFKKYVGVTPTQFLAS